MSRKSFTPDLIHNGMPVFISPLCVMDELVQFRFPKSKKQRIRKKWSKNNLNYRLEKVDRAFVVQGKLFVSERIYKELSKKPG